MSWTRKRLIDFDDPPDWLLEERAKQRTDIAELRKQRRRTGLQLFSVYCSKALVGPGPWPWKAFFDAWHNIAITTLVSRKWIRGGGSPLVGFGRGWCKRELRAMGYSITGVMRTQTERERVVINGVPALDPATGKPLYTVRPVGVLDTRQIERLS